MNSHSNICVCVCVCVCVQGIPPPQKKEEKKRKEESYLLTGFLNIFGMICAITLFHIVLSLSYRKTSYVCV